jgi:hypothetical protein
MGGCSASCREGMGEESQCSCSMELRDLAHSTGPMLATRPGDPCLASKALLRWLVFRASGRFFGQTLGF